MTTWRTWRTWHFGLLAGAVFGLSGCAVLEQVISEQPAVPPQEAAYHYTLGVLNNLNGQGDEALRQFEAALAADPQSPQIAAELATVYAEKNQPAKALSIAGSSLRDHPDDADLNLLLAGLYMNSRQFEKAVAHYQKVLSVAPKNVNALFYLATTYGEMKRFPEAAATYTRVLAEEPNHFLAQYYLGKSLVETQDYRGAEQAFRQTLALRPKFDNALLDLTQLYDRQKKTAAAIDTLKDYLRRHPDKVSARLKLGEYLLREKRYDDAEREFNKILRTDRANRDVRMTLGLLYLESGRLEQAQDIFSKLAAAFPDDPRYAFLLASVYEEKKDVSRAISLYLAIPATSDFFVNARIRVALLRKKEGNLPAAVRTVEEALAARKEAHLFIFLSSLHEEAKAMDKAENALLVGLESLPSSTDLHYTLGALYEKTARFDDSIRQMETVLSLDPNYADALNFIGYSWADRGIRLEEAEKLIEKAYALKPGSGYILDSLGWVHFRQNRIDKALHYLRQAFDMLPQDGTIAEHLGDALAKAGRHQEAIDAYRRAQKSNPAGSAAVENKIRKLQGK